MNLRITTAIAVAAVLAFGVASPARADGDPTKGAQVFKKCLSCHRVGPGAKAVVGPPLNGLVGRKAGSIEGYSYSDANKNSGLTWDEATLTKYLKAPKEVVPGTKMAFVGLKKDEDIADVIAYLKTFDADGNPVQ